MRIISQRWWLASIALLLMAPPASATPLRSSPHRRCWEVPEGGSALVYVLAAGITCLGAMAMRSRSERPQQF